MTTKRKLPDFATDEEAERFVETADLSEYDFSDFVVSPIAFEPEQQRVDLPVPKPLLRKVKARAKRKGMTWERFVVEALENAVRPAKAG